MNKDKWLTIVFTIGSCPSGVLRAIGFFILAPLLYNAYEYLFNTGNTDGLKYVVYFADPYASWQKGAVENTNKLIRPYSPKQANFDDFTDQKIAMKQKKIDRRPRQKLNFQTPKCEVYKRI
jgi:transposase insI for insertion sequence element IS30B/C/D